MRYMKKGRYKPTLTGSRNNQQVQTIQRGHHSFIVEVLPGNLQCQLPWTHKKQEVPNSLLGKLCLSSRSLVFRLCPVQFPMWSDADWFIFFFFSPLRAIPAALLVQHTIKCTWNKTKCSHRHDLKYLGQLSQTGTGVGWVLLTYQRSSGETVATERDQARKFGRG